MQFTVAYNAQDVDNALVHRCHKGPGYNIIGGKKR